MLSIKILQSIVTVLFENSEKCFDSVNIDVNQMINNQSVVVGVNPNIKCVDSHYCQSNQTGKRILKVIKIIVATLLLIPYRHKVSKMSKAQLI